MQAAMNPLNLSATRHSPGPRNRLIEFLQHQVLLTEAEAIEETESAHGQWGSSPTHSRLKKATREAGQWNRFRLPRGDQPGLTSLEYAPLAERSWA